MRFLGVLLSARVGLMVGINGIESLPPVIL